MQDMHNPNTEGKKRTRYCWTLIVLLHAKLALNIQFNSLHMWNGPMKYHGPQTWPWWRFVAPRMVKLFEDRDLHSDGNPWSTASGRRIWFYTRWGAYYIDVVLDRRGFTQKLVQGWIQRWK